jgi:hypothetical protein
MSNSQNYDTKNLETLRRDLGDLRSQAREDGVLRSDTAEKPSGSTAAGAARRFAAIRRNDNGEGPDAEEKGKQLAARLLAMLRRVDNDTSPMVPGTDFTENGIKRLMDQFARPKANRRNAPLIDKLQKFLTTGPSGGKMIAGASVERIRMLANLLPQVEKRGWGQVRSHLARRKEEKAQPAVEALEMPPAQRPKRAKKRGAM